jgi:signal transduction histidine kinase
VRRRLLLSYLSITLFVLIALGLPLGVSYANTERRRLADEVAQDAASFVHRAGGFFDGRTDESRLQQAIDAYTARQRAHVVLTDAAGDVVVASRTAAPPGLGSAVTLALPVRSAGAVEGTVVLEVSEEPVDRRIRNNWLLLGALGGAILLVVGLVSTLLARSFTKPLDALDRGAARLGDGDLSTRVEVPDDPPELAGLARSFNATAERLEALVRSQQAFVADASHQLRTPLSALRLRLENLEAELPAEGASDDIERSLAEVQRLSQLVDSLLVLTRADAERRPPESVDVGEVLANRRDAWSAFAAERGVEIRVDTGVVHVRSVRGRLEQVLDNLLSNALDVAPDGTAIRVSLATDANWAIVSVRDAGPGIPPEQRVRAFDRFWRGGAARRDGGGFGLGLPIVRQLVVADGGDVSLGDAPEGGLAVVLRLPLAPAAPVPNAQDAPAAGRVPSLLVR